MEIGVFIYTDVYYPDHKVFIGPMQFLENIQAVMIPVLLKLPFITSHLNLRLTITILCKYMYSGDNTRIRTSGFV